MNKEYIKENIKYLLEEQKEKVYNSDIELIIGDCGSGKSSVACLVAQKYINLGHKVYSNLYIENCYKFDIDDFMQYDFGIGSVIIFDEGATYGLASRGEQYKKNNSQSVIEFFTTYRHYQVEKIIIISPSFDDILPVVRSRVKEIQVCKKPLIFSALLAPANILLKLTKRRKIKLTLIKYITKKIEIVGEKKSGASPKEVYQWIPLKRKYYVQNFSWRFYDSFCKKTLAKKKWTKWENKNRIQNVSRETLLDKTI